MLVRLLAGNRAGSVADIPLPNARVMLADGRAELPTSAAVLPLPDVETLVDPIASRDDRRAVGVAHRRRR